MDTAQLSTFDLFAGLDDDAMATIAAKCDEIEVLHATDLTGEGDFAHKFFVILDGEVDVSRDGEKIDTMAAGDFFGEVGLLTNAKRNARVMSRGRVRLAKIMHWDFNELAEQFPVLIERLEAVVAARGGDLDS